MIHVIFTLTDTGTVWKGQFPASDELKFEGFRRNPDRVEF